MPESVDRVRPVPAETLLAAAPPQNLEAERTVLAAMMRNPRVIEEVTDLITGADFYRPAHAMVFDAIVKLHAGNEPTDPIPVAAGLASAGLLGKVGGKPYLADLFGAATNVLTVAYYARQVRDCAIRRRLSEVGTRITQFALAPGVEPDDALERAAAELGGVDQVNAADSSVSLGDAFVEMLNALDNPDTDPGVPTGFPDLDGMLGNLRRGQLVIVGARPAVGKSLLLGDFARHACIERQIPGLFVSLEMPRHELVKRWSASMASVNLNHLTRARLLEGEWDRLSEAKRAILNAPLRIDVPDGLNLAGLRGRVRLAVRRYGVRVVFVDYLQLIHTASGAGKDRREQLDGVIRGLKSLAQSVDIPLVVAAQLSRAATEHQSQPQLSDFRETGEIENSADVGILIHRPDSYQVGEQRTRPGEADLIVAKQRNGPTGRVVVSFEGHYARFTSMSPDYEERDRPVDITEPSRRTETAS